VIVIEQPIAKSPIHQIANLFLALSYDWASSATNNIEKAEAGRMV